MCMRFGNSLSSLHNGSDLINVSSADWNVHSWGKFEGVLNELLYAKLTCDKSSSQGNTSTKVG